MMKRRSQIKKNVAFRKSRFRFTEKENIYELIKYEG